MVRPPPELPETVAACHQVIWRQYERIGELETEVAGLRLHVDELNRDVATLKRELYGSRRERFVPPQDTPEARLGEAPPPDASAPEFPVVTSSALPRPRRTSQGRRKRVLDQSLPREQVLHRLDETRIPASLWNDPRAKRFFRFVREEVEFQEPQIRVFEHYQEVIALDENAEETHWGLAFVAPPVLPRCYLGPSFLANLIASRFADHIPYYRNEDILARTGFTLHRATQWRWMRELAELLAPLAAAVRARVMRSRVVGIDETPIDILCPDQQGTRSSYLYARYGDASQPYVCFDFASHKTKENIAAIVGAYHGYLQSDAYICYELITAASANRILGVGCWAHARRKFEPLLPHSQAAWILRRIGALYDIEDRARELSDSARHALRQRESRPIVEQIHRWLEERDAQETPKAPLRAGLNYLRNRWELFTRFLDDGAIPIDNNRTEASIKGPVVGKKNWLYFGNETGGATAAVMYTLTMSCKRHHVDVQAYLADVLRRLRSLSSGELESLLPDVWIKDHPEARVHQRAVESHAAARRKRERRAERRTTAMTRAAANS